MKIIVPAALGIVLTISDFLNKLLSQIPRTGLYIQAAMPLILLLVCAYGISSRLERENRQVGIVPLIEAQKWFEYRYAERIRTPAKLLLIPLTALTVYYAWIVIPNGLVGRTHLSGFICTSAEGLPVRDGDIEVLDSVGEVQSVRAEPVDDLGFFYVELKWWGSKPAALRLSGSTCKTSDIPLSSAVTAALGCRNAPDQNNTSKGDQKIWSTPCALSKY